LRKKVWKGITVTLCLIAWVIFCFCCLPGLQESQRQKVYEQRREIIVEKRRMDNQMTQHYDKELYNIIMWEDQ